MNDQKYEEFAGRIEEALKKQVAESTGVLSLKRDAIPEVKKYYELCREQMKKRMALIDKSKPWNQQRLDRHKIAAAVCWAITRANPIDTDKAKIADHRTANEAAAFLAPLIILMSFAADDARRAGNPTLAGFFEKGPALPMTTDDHSFTVHVVRTLYWHRVRNNKADPNIDYWLDPFQLSIMFYMLEVFASLKGERDAAGV